MNGEGRERCFSTVRDTINLLEMCAEMSTACCFKIREFSSDVSAALKDAVRFRSHFYGSVSLVPSFFLPLDRGD
jgi:hypothetical protein